MSRPAVTRLRKEWRRLSARFRNTRPGNVARTLLRAGRLFLGPVEPRVASPRRERLVVTLTTIPERWRSLAPVLRSLLDQSEPADRIVLTLPHRSRRSGRRYPDPGEIDLPEGIDILRCEDDGPASKLLPTLRAEPGAAIVVVDDDVIYPRDFLRTLLAAHRRRPDAALGYRGVRLEPGVGFTELDHLFATGVAADTPVDVLFGTWGYLVPPTCLGEAVHDFSAVPHQVRWVDDVWISGHLARAGVPRLVVPARGLPIETPASWRAGLAGGINRSGTNDELALQLFAADW